MSNTPKIERPGVYQRWVSWKTYVKHGEEYEQRFLPLEEAALSEYGRTGKVQSTVEATHSWELIHIDLGRYSRVRLFQGERAAIKGEVFTSILGGAFSASYLSFMIEAFIHERFPRRFEGRVLRMMGFDTTMFLALAFTLGCKEPGVRLGRMLLEAYRGKWFIFVDRYPLFHFILRLFADWIGAENLSWFEAPLQEPVMNALFVNWKQPDPDRLAPFVLAACDFHTHRVRSTSAKVQYEFSEGMWAHFPAEILMLFRLRQSLGLDNPKVDHPLLNTPLGNLPPEGNCEPDELTALVLKRMSMDGFDEDAIYRSLCPM